MAATPAGELFLAVVLVLIILVFFFTLEGLYSAFTYSKQKMTPLMNYTASSTERTLAVHQDPTKYQDAIPILFSDNEPTGTEFAYSFYLYVNPSTFTNSAVLYHVWHKGFGCVWPLMGPGVFIRGETNTMRIVMNTFANPYTFVDVANIPVKKWFHVVLNCRRSGLEVHVNGNLANKIRFENTMAYQNFQDIVLFSNANYSLGGIYNRSNRGGYIQGRWCFPGNDEQLYVCPVCALLWRDPGSHERRSVYHDEDRYCDRTPVHE